MSRSSRQGSRGDLAWASGLFLAALALRLTHLFTVGDSPFFSILYIDPRMYDEWGQRIASGQLLSERPFFLDPLYPYFLGAVFKIFGHRYEAVVAIQSFLGAAVPPLVFLAARPWFDVKTARLAGVLAVLYLPSIYFGGLIMKPGLSLFLMSLTLWLLSRALDGARVAAWPAAGIALGLTCLTRGNLILIVPVFALWLLLRGGPGGEPRIGLVQRAADRARLIQVGGFLIGTALVLAMPAAHNHAVGGEWILSTANAGANFFIGNNPSNASGEYQQLPFINANPMYEQRDFRLEAERRGAEELTDRGVSAFWFGESWNWIRSEPAGWLGLMWRKFRSFWGAYEIPDSLDYYLYSRYAPVLRLPLPGFGLLAPLGLLGAALALRRPGWPRMLLVFTAAYSLSIIVFFVFSRFRMVVMPALFVFAAFGAFELARRLRAALQGTERRPSALALGLLLVFFVFVNFPVRAKTDSWSYRVAASLKMPVRAETQALGQFNLGLAYARRAKQETTAGDVARTLELAETELREALRQETDPGHTRIHVELGKVLARQKRNPEAIEIYRRAAEIEPNDYQIHHALGILHRRNGEPESAAEGFGTALRLAPGHAPSATRLGEVLLTLQRPKQAAEAFRHALEVSPGNRAALKGLRASEATRSSR